MTKIPPFGVDVRGASDEQREEFLRLLEIKGYRKFKGICEYYGWSIHDFPDNAVEKDEAIQKFTRIISIEQGIAILKGEEEPKQPTGITDILKFPLYERGCEIPLNINRLGFRGVRTDDERCINWSDLFYSKEDAMNPPKQ